MRKIFVWTICLSLLFCTILFAWDDNYTHPHITEKALDASALDEYLYTVLNIPERTELKINGIRDTKSILEWFQYGSKQEDSPKCRASNHFHNPLEEWHESGLTDTTGLTRWLCSGDDAEYPPDKIKSNVAWATGFKAPGVPDEATYLRNTWDWHSARYYYYLYLSKNAYYYDNETGSAYSGEPAISQALADSFRSLGQVMHLLQDVAVPAHVRNDFSKGHMQVIPERLRLLGLESFLSNLLADTGNMFEIYASKTFSEEYILNGKGAPPWFRASGENENGEKLINLTQKTLTNFWDTDNYKGEAHDIMLNLNQIGLAEYTNYNFVSAATIFTEGNLDDENVKNDKHYFPFPRRESIEAQLEAYGYNDILPVIEVRDGVLMNPRYAFSTATSHNEEIKSFVTPSYLSKVLYEEIGQGDNQYYDMYYIYFKSFGLNTDCYTDYAKLLIPRAISYSASLLDYFFRGRLEITQAVPVLRHNSFKYISVSAKNITPTEEALADGEFTISCRYTPKGKNPDGSEDEFTHSNSYPCKSLEYNQEVTRMFFTFINPIPKDAEIKKITLAYKGKLGEEKDAVIGTVLDADDLIQHDFGKIIFEEDWKNAPTDDDLWTHANVSAEQGECSSIVENGILTKKNIRYAGQKIDPWNTSKYIPATPILITPDSSLQFKIDHMTVSHDIEASQYIDLKFTNGTGLFFTHDDGKLFFRPGTGFYHFPLGFIILDNIYDLLKNAQIATPKPPEELYLEEVSFIQMMWPVNLPTESQHEQHMTSDFIQVIEGIHK